MARRLFLPHIGEEPGQGGGDCLRLGPVLLVQRGEDPDLPGCGGEDVGKEQIVLPAGGHRLGVRQLLVAVCPDGQGQEHPLPLAADRLLRGQHFNAVPSRLGQQQTDQVRLLPGHGNDDKGGAVLSGEEQRLLCHCGGLGGIDRSVHPAHHRLVAESRALRPGTGQGPCAVKVPVRLSQRLRPGEIALLQGNGGQSQLLAAHGQADLPAKEGVIRFALGRREEQGSPAQTQHRLAQRQGQLSGVVDDNIVKGNIALQIRAKAAQGVGGACDDAGKEQGCQLGKPPEQFAQGDVLCSRAVGPAQEIQLLLQFLVLRDVWNGRRSHVEQLLPGAPGELALHKGVLPQGLPKLAGRELLAGGRPLQLLQYQRPVQALAKQLCRVLPFRDGLGVMLGKGAESQPLRLTAQTVPAHPQLQLVQMVDDGAAVVLQFDEPVAPLPGESGGDQSLHLPFRRLNGLDRISQLGGEGQNLLVAGKLGPQLQIAGILRNPVVRLHRLQAEGIKGVPIGLRPLVQAGQFVLPAVIEGVQRLLLPLTTGEGGEHAGNFAQRDRLCGQLLQMIADFDQVPEPAAVVAPV